MSDQLDRHIDGIAELAEKLVDDIISVPKAGSLKLPKPLDPQVKEIIVLLMGHILVCNTRITALEHSIQHLLSCLQDSQEN